MKKKLWSYGGILLAMAVLSMGCSKIGKSAETETESKEGQREATIQVISITGNEMTYIEQEEETESTSEAESKAETEAVPEPESKAETEAMSEAESNAETEAVSEPESTAESQASSEKAGRQGGRGMNRTGQNGSGGMPDMSQMGSGEMPDMSQMGGGEMPDMSQMGSGGMPDMSQISSMFGMETVTVYLPVAVPVYTDTGKKTTFSILQAGDELRVIFETDEEGNEVITEIRITGAN